MASLFRLKLLANHFPPLHGLRVVAITWIIQIHLSFELGERGMLPRLSWVYLASQKLWFAMDLFFVLSGFLIGTILLSSSEGKGASGILKFYGRRAFRIFPLYYFVLTWIALTMPNSDPLRRVNLWREYAYLTNYTDTAHVYMFWGWSLCVEEHFYLLVPLLFVALGPAGGLRKKLWALAALWASALAVRIAIPYLLQSPPDGHLYFTRIYIPTHTRYDTLVAGVLLAFVQRERGGAIREALARPRARWAARAALTLAFAGLLFPPPLVPPGLWNLFSLGTLSSLAWGGLILYLLGTEGLLSRALGAKIFLKMATLGYGVYLVHMPLVLAFGLPTYALARINQIPSAPALVVGTLVAFAAALLEAYILHLLVEKPALALRDKIVP